MAKSLRYAPLSSRALIRLSGADWRSFLQGLITQDVESLSPGEARFAALLTPQGRLLYDLFVVGSEDGCWLDVAAEHRDAFIQRLALYRLRAKLEIAADQTGVSAVFQTCFDNTCAPSTASRSLSPEVSPSGEDLSGQNPPLRSGGGGGDADGGGVPLDGAWVLDPRLPQLGWRGYGASAPEGAELAGEVAYEAHRLGLGVPAPADWGAERTYPIEANFDLLGGIDFKKGCFVGQETTSRMKRRGQIKNRMLPITFDGPSPPPGAEVLAGELRAGEVRSGQEGRAMALLRLDRIAGAALSVAGRPVRAAQPAWLSAALGQAA